MSGSSVPEVLAALVVTFRAASPLDLSRNDTDRVRRGVFDGQPGEAPPAAFLAVAWDRSDQPAVSASQAPLDLAGSITQESMSISSLLSFSYDANTLSDTRIKLFTTYNALVDALRQDPTLGGLGSGAKSVDYDLTQLVYADGSVLDLRFTTEFEAVK